MPLSEKEKMLAGSLYDGMDPELVRERLRAREVLRKLSEIAPTDLSARSQMIHELVGYETDVWIEPPFHCDYGTNIRFGARVYLNVNCVLLDVTPITIGDRCMFGPGVQIFTATHPLDAELRRRGLESGKPISIGEDVWIGGGAIICPGVRVGDRSVIGAGSVVTKDVPPDVVVGGNPARILRSLEPPAR